MQKAAATQASNEERPRYNHCSHCKLQWKEPLPLEGVCIACLQGVLEGPLPMLPAAAAESAEVQKVSKDLPSPPAPHKDGQMTPPPAAHPEKRPAKHRKLQSDAPYTGKDPEMPDSSTLEDKSKTQSRHDPDDDSAGQYMFVACPAANLAIPAPSSKAPWAHSLRNYATTQQCRAAAPIPPSPWRKLS